MRRIGRAKECVAVCVRGRWMNCEGEYKVINLGYCGLGQAYIRQDQ